MNHTIVNALRAVLMGALMFVTGTNAMAQESSETPTGVVVHGNVYGGGNQAGVLVNTAVNMSIGQVDGNVYGGGNVGSVGTYTTSDDMKTFTFTENTGVCSVTIDGGTIGTGVGQSADGTFADGNVYGAGKGKADTYWCEKAMSYKTTVTINAGTIGGTVYGGGQIGRVENNARVIIGVETPANETPAPTIAGNVFGAGAGLATHGYSALLRGDAEVTVQGNARIGLNVYGGGEKASVGRFKIVGGLPSEPADDGSGDCTVNVRGKAVIGTNTDVNITDKGNVFGTCQGVAAPSTFTAYDTQYKSMQAVVQKAPVGDSGTAWEYVEGSTDYYWEYYPTLDAYQGFLNTLALTSHPVVTIGGMLSNETTGAVIPSGNPTVNGSVYGGGQRGITLGTVAVNIAGGTVNQDVYGGGALADTNKGNQTAEKYDVAKVTVGETAVTGMYERSGAGTDESPYVYAVTEDTKAADGKTYYTKAAQSSINTTTVNLTGGTIKGDAYGGGLGQKIGFNDAQGVIATKDVEAVVWGDINVTLGGNGGSTATSFYTTYEKDNDNNDVLKSGRVFGCNNLLGSPRGDVTVTVWTTVDGKNAAGETITKTDVSKKNSTTETDHTYRLAAVYGGGNLASYEASGKKAHVIIHGCENTSILTVYGGGNAAAVPETDVDVYSAYEIGSLFGGGNGKDKYKKGNTWLINPGADVNGNANTMVYGGTVHEAYGASNEKGTITGDVAIDVSNVNSDNCPLDVAKIVGAGKNADVNGNLILVMGCKPSTLIPLVYGGADNANVNGNVELTITSGNFTKVFGGNNAGGAIRGYIKLNIEETGSCETPITIDQLYLGGNEAAYSIYGYYIKTEETEAENGTGTGASTETAILSNGRLQFMPRQSASDTHLPVDTYTFDEANNKWTWTTSAIDAFTPYDEPELNVISCTRIGEVFGGGFGTGATMYADPTVNINMIKGHFWDNQTLGVPKVMTDLGLNSSENPNGLGIIGNVYGGGNAAKIEGSTTVNIGTATTVNLTSIPDDDNTNNVDESLATVKGAYIVGNVYGGGNEADVTGNTFVNICAKKETDGTYTSVAFVASDVKITSKTVNGEKVGGNVYGGGKGKADTFTCEKAMIGTDGAGLNADYTDGNTSVVIGNGTIDGTVYGGGQIGRVERNTTVTIGLGNGEATGTPPTSAPEINGNVFGAGAGEEEHGYAALVRGNPTVTIQGNAKIGKSVYGGGEIASVARYKVAETVEEATEHGVAVDMPYVLESSDYGHCKVTIGGYAEIGPDNMKMYHTNVAADKDAPDDAGHVFGAGKGVLPKVYTSYGEAENGPKRMVLDDDKTTSIWEYFVDEEKYFEFIRTLALATETQVTIGDHAFVKGSVYGGSENGIVQYDTNVTIKDHCQIGQGKEITMRYEDYTGGDLFELTTPPVKSGSGSETVYYDLECASWDYGSDTNADGKKDLFAPYDPNANATGDLDKYPAVGTATAKSTEGGRRIATDGHTFYGNVFGGGSGSVPYFDTTKGVSRYIMSAGWVKGNTNVTISGGHILTNVYGGNEATNVDGTATITMTGGTIGVPRTLQQIVDHPVTCYLFGAGKGDQRVFFNKDTNVRDVEVEITGGKIFGSVFGGGEDGHVLRDVTMTIGKVTTTGEGDEAATTISGPTIGNWGTSYVDGNVFGGGRGFGGDAYTAGNIAGSVEMEIKGGNILGSIYGGGRLGSVGYGLFDAETNGQPTPGYGEMRADTDTETGFSTTGFFTKGRGHIDITISGGTIGNDWEFVNVPTDINESGLAAWKTTNHVPYTEYETTTETIEENSTTTTLYHHRLKHTKGGNVFAGGMGRFYQLDGLTPISSVDWRKLGCVKSTKLTITGGTIKSNVYGGGELGQVVGHHTLTTGNDVGTEISISGSAQIGTEVKNGGTTEYTFGSVFGGGYGSLLDDLTVNVVTTHPKFDAGLVKEDTKIDMQGGAVKASIYGGGEMASVGESTTSGETTTATGSTYVSMSGGKVGIEPITLSDNSKRYFGGAKMGNVYGGGSGHGNTVRSGKIFNSTNVTISGGTIFHNVYGGGAYGTVGDFDYQTGSDYDGGPIKVQGINGLATTGTGVANVTITGGTIGYDGKENGMVFGSSRGDINQPGARDDHCAWVYDTHVTIGTAATPAQGTEGQEGYVAATTATGPAIKGSVYGSGENGHVFNNTVVTVNGGTIGIYESTDPGYTVTSNGTSYSGAAYPYRGNVYGGGCGTDKYYSDHSLENHSGGGDTFNALAGIVYGETKVYIKGGEVVRNVYGAGAMGSVGRIATETTNEVTTTTISGGLTTINVSGGTIGTSGTVGDGNVFGAARGDEDATGDDLSRVFVTSVTVSGGIVKGNVYGGGELGDVGIIDKSDKTNYNFVWTGMNNSTNTSGNNTITGTNNNTGVCSVTVSGGTIGTGVAANADGVFSNGNVYGVSKGSSTTWWCEKAIAYATNVSVSGGTVRGTVYGGGEVGRVEDDAKVTIGVANATGETPSPSITGNVFGAGAGIKTHGYSALVRGNAEVIVQGKSVVEGSVYGGGEIASVGKFHVDKGLPVKPMNGGTCKVLIQDEAQIGSSGTGHNVFGACKGVTPVYNNTVNDPNRSKSMQLKINAPSDNSLWSNYNNDATSPFIWRYYATEADYLDFLKTLALTSNTHVTIDEDATVYGSVFGGGERGVTLGGVDVNITGGTVNEDVYGGGSLADSNVAMWNSELNQRVTWVALPELIAGTSATGYYTAESADALITDPDAVVQSNTIYYANYKTNVNLTGGTVEGNVFGGGLGQLEKAAVNYTEEEAVAYNTEHSLTEDDADYKTTASVKVAAQSAVAAKVYGNVSVKLNEPTTSGQTTTYGNCEVKGTIFGCNNLNGSPQAGVDVHIYKTVKKNDSGTVIAKPAKNTNNYEVTAVYGGGNLAAYYPDDETVREAETTKAYVTIDGCELTSIGSVYGGGNAASVPATEVVVNGTYEIGEVFGGGNGNDDVSYDGVTYVTNPGANVGYLAYTDDSDKASKVYGIGKSHATIYGGTVHTVYGGSNLRGNVRVESRTTLEEVGECDFAVGDAYGGGNNADQDGDAVLEAGCIQGLDIAYGGASNADVNGDVKLNITNGTYGRVFGGNNLGGVIRGTITVNIEETGCRPIVIGQLYGGGNLASYTVENISRSREDLNFTDPTAENYYKNFPKVNVKSFTSIGTIFGGGFGIPAELVGNPQVNVNVYEGKYYNTFKGNENVINENAKVVGTSVKYSGTGYDSGYPIPYHKKGAIGAINDVFGGGNLAKVIGNPTVNIGTEAGEEVYVAVEVKEGEELKGYCTRTGEGTTESPYQYSELTEGTAPNTATYYLKTVKAVDIRGNVFGGGNNAEVEGDTNVVIGRKKITTP